MGKQWTIPVGWWTTIQWSCAGEHSYTTEPGELPTKGWLTGQDPRGPPVCTLGLQDRHFNDWAANLSCPLCSSLIQLKLPLFSTWLLLILALTEKLNMLLHYSVLICIHKCICLCSWVPLCVCMWANNPSLEHNLLINKKQESLKNERLKNLLKQKQLVTQQSDLAEKLQPHFSVFKMKYEPKPEGAVRMLVISIWISVLFGFLISGWFSATAWERTPQSIVLPQSTKATPRIHLVLSVSGDCIPLILFWPLWYLLSTLSHLSPHKLPMVVLNLAGGGFRSGGQCLLLTLYFPSWTSP